MKSRIKKKAGIVFAFCLFLAGAFYLKKGYIKAQKWTVRFVDQKLQEFADTENIKGLKWGPISARLWALNIQIENIEITLPNEKSLPEPVTIKSLRFSPDYKALSRGLIAGKILIKEPKLKILLNTQNQKNNSYLRIDSLRNFFITQLNIESADLLLNIRGQAVSADSLSAQIELHRQSIQFSSQVQELKTQSETVFFSSLEGFIKKGELFVENFILRNQNSKIRLSANLKGSLAKKDIQYFHIITKSDFYPEELTDFVTLVRPGANPLGVEGKITLNGGLTFTPDSYLSGQIDAKAAKNFRVGDFALGSITAKMDFKNYILTFKKLNIKQSDQWNISLKNSKMVLKKPYDFQTDALIRESRLKSLFDSFGLKSVPVSAGVKGRWECRGNLLNLKPSFYCKGKSLFKNIFVYDSSQDNILKAPILKTEGSMALSESGFTTNIQALAGTQTDLHFSSRLTAKGVFSAQVHGRLNFEDIQNLIQLEPEGLVKIQHGSITADKNQFEIRGALQAENFILSRFIMGNVNTLLHYTQNGILSFERISGVLNKSRYKGNVRVNIPNNSIKLFASFPSLNLKNLKQALKDRLYFPFELDGAGRLTAYVSGPLKINALSYNLDAEFSKVIWEKEPFTKAVIQVESKNGYVKTKKVEIFKKNGQAVFTGKVNPKGELQALITGEGFYLQESPNISKLVGPDLMGLMNFDMYLNGFFLKPLTLANVKIINASLKGYSIADSNIDLRIRENQVIAKGRAAGKINIKNFIYPYKAGGEVVIQADTKDLNIKELFFHKGDVSQLYNNFESKIDSHWDVKYKREQFEKTAQGGIHIKKMALQSNARSLLSQKPFLISLKKGRVFIEPAILKEDTSVLNISQKPSGGPIDIQGSIKLDFLAFLFPFMRQLQGNIQAKINLQPNLSRLSPSGRLSLQDGLIQIHSELEPFEKVQAEFKVDNTKLLVNNFSAQFGGGLMQGSKGFIHFKERNLNPVNIKGSFSNTEFNSIPGISAKGSGAIRLTGQGFPYTLGIEGELDQTRIEKEFSTGLENTETDIISKWSFIKKSTSDFEPIDLNLNLTLKNPAQLENSTIETLLSGKVKITGYPLSPLLTGRFTAPPGGTVIFRDHEFEILSAEVLYTNSPPDQPEIDLRADSVIQEQSSLDDFSEEYNLSLRVKGRGENADFDLTSTPELTKDEIVSLLAFGTRAGAFEKGDNLTINTSNLNSALNNAAQYSYHHLGPALFQKAIGQELKETLGVDQFLIIPHRNPKKSTPSTKLILRKKMFKKLNISASQTVLDESPERDVKLEYKLNKNMSVVGFWKNEDPLEETSLENNTLGLDLEYQFDF